MSSTLTTPVVAELIQRLFGEETQQMNQLIERSLSYREAGTPATAMPSDFKDMYLAVDPEAGNLLYIMARLSKADTIVEFGTSFGISSIYLASALRDNGGGHLITAEIEKHKARKATENFKAVGLSDLIEVRTGDALDTLAELPSGVDLVFLDGWPDLYLPVLKLIEPRLGPAAAVIADYLPPESFIDPVTLKPYQEYVADPANGYVTVDLPIGDTISLALRLR